MKEIKVYGVNTVNSEFDWSAYDPESTLFDEKSFIELAELQGNIWSLKGFQEQFNFSLINELMEHMYIYIYIE